MRRKSIGLSYYTHKIKITPKSQILSQLQDAPISDKDYCFMVKVLSGLSYKELAEVFDKSEARIYQWKRTLFEKLYEYDINSMNAARLA